MLTPFSETLRGAVLWGVFTWTISSERQRSLLIASTNTEAFFRCSVNNMLGEGDQKHSGKPAPATHLVVCTLILMHITTRCTQSAGSKLAVLSLISVSSLPPFMHSWNICKGLSLKWFNSYSFSSASPESSDPWGTGLEIVRILSFPQQTTFPRIF